MAPISPISRKRSTPSDDGLSDAPISKRRRIEPDMPHTPPPEENSNTQKPKIPPMFDDDPHTLLKRSVALALEHVGFAGAEAEALEAVCAEVDTCQYLLALLQSMY